MLAWPQVRFADFHSTTLISQAPAIDVVYDSRNEALLHLPDFYDQNKAPALTVTTVHSLLSDRPKISQFTT